jgi:hypothetical protein
MKDLCRVTALMYVSLLLDSEMISGVFVAPRTYVRTRAHTHTHTHTHTGVSVLWPPALQRSISVAPKNKKLTQVCVCVCVRERGRERVIGMGPSLCVWQFVDSLRD